MNLPLAVKRNHFTFVFIVCCALMSSCSHMGGTDKPLDASVASHVKDPDVVAPAEKALIETVGNADGNTKGQVSPNIAEMRASTTVLASTDAEKKSIAKLCSEIDRLYKKNKWADSSICSKVDFSIFGYSVKGRPLLSASFGDPKSDKMTLIQCAIHGDELPSLAMCFLLIKEVLIEKRPLPKGVWLVVQPLLNPDGMLEGKPQRPNIRGVDINRNFPTDDFASNAMSSWKKRDHQDLRKFPGEAANSEPETQALVKYVATTGPQKIISIHTPLGHLDLDAKGKGDQERRARFLAINMSKNSGNYTFKTFGFFPGSLGNFAGREKQIPVYTLELPPGESKPTVDSYWRRFRIALWRAIDFDLDTGQFIED